MNDDDYSSDEVPTYVGVLPVYKVLNFDPGVTTSRLVSPIRSRFAWMQGENVAKCMYGCRRPGGKGCVCGFYGCWSIKSILHYRLPCAVAVIAVCDAYGKITYGTKGVRAEKMKIKAFINPTLMSRVLVGSAPLSGRVAFRALPKQLLDPKIMLLILALQVLLAVLVATPFGSLIVDWVMSVAAMALGASLVVLDYLDRRRLRQWEESKLYLGGDSVENVYLERRSRSKELLEELFPGVPVFSSPAEAAKFIKLPHKPEDLFADYQ